MSNEDRFAAERKEIEAYFIPENAITDATGSVTSPSGTYRLDIQRYHTKPKAWQYSRGIVRRTADDHVVADIKRNYPNFWHSWVDHSNGNEYLLCGEDYQGYSVVNLTEEKTHHYLTAEALKGGGFCWIDVYPSPDSLVLAVLGCIWAAPYELILYDFSDPSTLPLPQIKRFGEPEGCEEVEDVVGWENNHTFVLKCRNHFRKTDGARIDTLSANEQSKLFNDPTLLDSRLEEIRWARTEK